MPIDIDHFITTLAEEVKGYQVPVVDLIAVQTNDPYRILVATILSARTRDEVTAKAANRLFKDASDLESLARLSEGHLAELIRPVGFFRNKAGYLARLPGVLAREFNHKIPATVEQLCKLPGVGRKTANLVVAVAFKKPAICVDTHVHRIMNIWGYVETATPLATEMALRKKLPEKYWLTVNSILVAFGQGTCKPQRPHCDRCVLNDSCPQIGVTPRKIPGRAEKLGGVLKIIPCLLLPLFLSACALYRPTETVLQPPEMAAGFSIQSQQGEINPRWWEDFDSKELNQLVTISLAGNFSVKQAGARLAQARYTATKAGAARFPQLEAQMGSSITETKERGSSGTSSTEWSFGFLASYEVDLWGRVMANQESYALLTRASEEDLRTAVMTVTGELTEIWIKLISIRKQQILFAEQIALQEKLLELIKKRFPLGKSSALDIYQQQQTIESIRTSMIPLAAEEKSLVRQLALLIGKNSISPDYLPPPAFPTVDELPAIGLPADLLAARPDIRAAGLRLKSGEWDLAAARADRLPALSLTASHTFQDEKISSIFDNWLLNLAANLVGPILDGHQRQTEVEINKAVVEERVAEYGNTVFTAIKEVEDSLANESHRIETLKLLNNQRKISEKTVREATGRYLNGSSDFINVLREELNILEIKQDLIKTNEGRLIARIELYKALGGSWVNNLRDTIK